MERIYCYYYTRTIVKDNFGFHTARVESLLNEAKSYAGEGETLLDNINQCQQDPDALQKK